jgi:hypothetical protein
MGKLLGQAGKQHRIVIGQKDAAGHAGQVPVHGDFSVGRPGRQNLPPIAHITL